MPDTYLTCPLAVLVLGVTSDTSQTFFVPRQYLPSKTLTGNVAQAFSRPTRCRSGVWDAVGVIKRFCRDKQRWNRVSEERHVRTLAWFATQWRGEQEEEPAVKATSTKEKQKSLFDD